MHHTPELYPESYPRIIPQKITIMNGGCIGLTSFNGPDKLIYQCWPDPMIPGYLHIPTWVVNLLHARGVSSLSLSWLAGWLAGWLVAAGWLLVGWLAIGLASCGWLAAWLATCCVVWWSWWGWWGGGWLRLWLAGWLATRPKIRRRGTLA